MSASSFSNGQIFGYWSSWKGDNRPLNYGAGYDYYAHNGHLKSHLFISPTYDSIKQEVFQSSFMNVKEWYTHLIKLREYEQSQRVKSMNGDTIINGDFIFGRYKPCNFKYGITSTQLLCLILYCDKMNSNLHFQAHFVKSMHLKVLMN